MSSLEQVKSENLLTKATFLENDDDLKGILYKLNRKLQVDKEQLEARGPSW